MFRDQDQVLIGGDLNVVLNPELDKVGGRKKISKAAEIINTFLDEVNWIDVWATVSSRHI